MEHALQIIGGVPAPVAGSRPPQSGPQVAGIGLVIPGGIAELEREPSVPALRQSAGVVCAVEGEGDGLSLSGLPALIHMETKLKVFLVQPEAGIAVLVEPGGGTVGPGEDHLAPLFRCFRQGAVPAAQDMVDAGGQGGSLADGDGAAGGEVSAAGTVEQAGGIAQTGGVGIPAAAGHVCEGGGLPHSGEGVLHAGLGGQGRRYKQ